MTFSLNKIQNTFIRHKFFLLAGLVILILSIAIVAQQAIRRAKPRYTPPPSSQQPVSNGKLDTTAPEVQLSKNALDLIKPKLPHNQTITTSTGTKVSYLAFVKTPDLYELHVAIIGIDFTTLKEDPKFPLTVQDFRDTASSLYDFLTSNGVNPSALYIIWADNFQNQKTAESWLNPSAEFPKVVKQNGKYIFEKQ